MATVAAEPTQAPFSAFRRGRTAGGNRAFHNFYNDYSHIADPNLRRRLALTEIDKVPFGMYHVRAVLVAGIGFFVDAYAIYSLNLIIILLGVVFYSGDRSMDGFGGNNGILPDSVGQALKASTLGGMVIGQVAFGWLADVFGRRKMYGIELGVIMIATLGCTLVAPSQAVNFTLLMVFWRVIIGFGIGGDYPMSSIITAEFAPTRWRGGMVAAVFAMQGLGQLMAAVVALAVASAFKDSYINAANEADCDSACQLAADRAWRIIIGVGAIPACLAMYYRITIPETPRYTFDVAHDIEKGDADIRAYMASEHEGRVNPVRQATLKEAAAPSMTIPQASWEDARHYFGQWKNARVLIGTSLSWFFLDFAVFGLSLNLPKLLQAIGFATGESLYHKIVRQAIGTIILASAGALPGYVVAILSVDTLGRKGFQTCGFIVLAVLFCIVGFAYEHLSQIALLGLLVVISFVFSAGPSATTFIISGECLPTRYRATGHGFAASAGKIGAIIAQGVSIPLLGPETNGLNRLLQLLALAMLLGSLASLLIPETKGITLEELGGELPTSYNAGRNGSIGFAYRHRWNPFSNGQQAGFNYPRSLPNTSAAAAASMAAKSVGKSETSHSNGGASITPKKRGGSFGFSAWSRKDRVGTNMSDESISAAADNHNNNTSIMSSMPTVGPDGKPRPGLTIQVPSEADNWGAGWGRMDRGRTTTDPNALQLNDVSNLLIDRSSSRGSNQGRRPSISPSVSPTAGGPLDRTQSL